ncbi:NAD(P)H-binding protein [Actinomadura barringtoniae]|uniref:NAD(P)H-binding protein n=1 Tax=Actinomadura barringtoniae TaxID=1427535 RepID=A0A939PLR5_9ACTN|nr:NAD(P)H-binding protein [Actinomadura barringtoniae]MBO2454640.1 NAD(P)H-binding protein [Actinomadura barringtoniae]
MILVTGATGSIGGAVTRLLDAAGASVRVLVRDPARAAALPERAERVVADLSDPATLAPAFEGAAKLFLLTPGIGTDMAASAVAAAQAAGVGHIVLLSSTNVLGDPVSAMGRWHHEREEIVRASGIPATILRPDGFMTNALQWAGTIREGGYVFDPLGPGRIAVIDTADIAAVAALVLTEDGHQGQEYALTGGEALTVAEQVAAISAAIGRDLKVRPAGTPEEAVRARFPSGAPPVLAEALIDAIERVRAAPEGLRTDTFERLVGRPPVTFADWCARNAGAFAGAA